MLIEKNLPASSTIDIKCRSSVSKLLVVLEQNGDKFVPSPLISHILSKGRATILVNDSSGGTSNICSNIPISYLAAYDAYEEGYIPTTSSKSGCVYLAFTISLTPDGAAFELDNDEQIDISLNFPNELSTYKVTVYGIEAATRSSLHLTYNPMSLSNEISKSFNLGKSLSLLLPPDSSPVDRFILTHTNTKSVSYTIAEIKHLQSLNNDFYFLDTNGEGCSIKDKIIPMFLVGASTVEELTVQMKDLSNYTFYSVGVVNRTEMVDRVNKANQSLVPIVK